MFRVHFKDKFMFWLLLSYRPWRDRVVNGHWSLPEEENILQMPEIHHGSMPVLRGKSHLPYFFPACTSSLRKYSFGGPWPSFLHLLFLFLCPFLLGSPVENPCRLGNLGTHSLDKAGLKLNILPDSASQSAGIKGVCHHHLTTTVLSILHGSLYPELSWPMTII